VKFYNMYMGAVDLFDQLRSYVALHVRARKFWHPMFWFIIESALVNAWVLYKATRKAANLPIQYIHFTFRMSIALALASEWEDTGCKTKVEDATSPTKHYQKTKVVRAHTSSDHPSPNSDAVGDRFTAPDKHMRYLTKIPALEGSTAKKRQMLCVECKLSRSTWWCKKCAKPLCRDSCYV
jgi:hypothetical protein